MFQLCMRIIGNVCVIVQYLAMRFSYVRVHKKESEAWLRDFSYVCVQ
jgi:hypothetical protein